MKTTFAVLAVLCLPSIVLRTASGQVQYAVTDLGTLSGGTASGATGINNLGQVVGWAYTSGGVQHAFLYSGGTMRDLGTLPGGKLSYAYGINNNGQVVGYADSSGGVQHAFFYSGVMQDLGTLGGTNSVAAGINNNGQIAGSADTNGGDQHAFLYSGGSMQDIGTLPVGAWSVANGINDNGQIVGDADAERGPLALTHAFLYSNGSMQDLGTLGGLDSWAYGINNSGQIVGSSNISGGAEHAFLHSGSGSLVLATDDLGTFGGTNSRAQAINNNGQVVGWADTSSGAQDAFLYDSGVLHDLNNLIPSNSGWTLEQATGINDSGKICGYGINPSGQTDAFLLTPASFWASAVSGSWSNSSNWTNGLVPNADGAMAAINASTTSTVSVTLDEPVTLGTLLLGSGSATTGYTLSGSNTLMFSNTSNNSAATISVMDGTHVIDAPVVLASNLVVTSTSSNPWTLSFGTASSITDNGNGNSLTLSASNGTLVLSGSDTYAGGTIVTAGLLIAASNTALPNGSSLTVEAGGTFLFDPSVSASPLAMSQINPVPEPSTIVLLGIGAVGLFGLRSGMGAGEVSKTKATVRRP